MPPGLIYIGISPGFKNLIPNKWPISRALIFWTPPIGHLNNWGKGHKTCIHPFYCLTGSRILIVTVKSALLLSYVYIFVVCLFTVVVCPYVELPQGCVRRTESRIYDVVVEYICLPGRSFPDGTRTRTTHCQANGHWSVIPPPCLRESNLTLILIPTHEGNQHKNVPSPHLSWNSCLRSPFHNCSDTVIDRFHNRTKNNLTCNKTSHILIIRAERWPKNY